MAAAELGNAGRLEWDDGFVLARSAGTVENEDRNGLTDSQRKVLDRIRENGPRGAAWKELLGALNGAKSTLSRATYDLTRWNLITKRNRRYHIVGPVEPESGEDTPNADGSTRFQKGSVEPLEPGKSGHGSTGSTTRRGGTLEPFAGTPADTPRDEGLTAVQEKRVSDLLRRGFGAASARAEVLAAGHPIGCECEVCL
jgi:hypothetical protein